MHPTEYKVIRSHRKTVALQITAEGHLLVRAPWLLSDKSIREFVDSKSNWIEKNRKRVMAQPDPLTPQQLSELKAKAAEVFARRVAYYAPQIGVTYGRITIRAQKTRWGSCSGKGNLNFNCRLLLAPPEVLDYVVIHELCHRKEMNHSPQFWALVEQFCPEYKTLRRNLLSLYR